MTSWNTLWTVLSGLLEQSAPQGEKKNPLQPDLFAPDCLHTARCIHTSHSNHLHANSRARWPTPACLPAFLNTRLSSFCWLSEMKCCRCQSACWLLGNSQRSLGEWCAAGQTNARASVSRSNAFSLPEEPESGASAQPCKVVFVQVEGLQPDALMFVWDHLPVIKPFKESCVCQ